MKQKRPVRPGNPGEHPDERLQEVASLYALGALDQEEKRTFEEHLASGCGPCATFVAGLHDTVASVDLASVEPVAPPARLKQDILARLHDEPQVRRADVRGPARPASRSEANGTPASSANRTQVWKSWRGSQGFEMAPGLFTLRAADGAWEETDAPGVAVKPLFVDEERSYVTMLVRMAAGSSYPGHLHGGVEECLVLEGDLQVEGEELRAGDYQRAEASSQHGTQWTKSGCLLLIVSSQHDALL